MPWWYLHLINLHKEILIKVPLFDQSTSNLNLIVVVLFSPNIDDVSKHRKIVSQTFWLLHGHFCIHVDVSFCQKLPLHLQNRVWLFPVTVIVIFQCFFQNIRLYLVHFYTLAPFYNESSEHNNIKHDSGHNV